MFEKESKEYANKWLAYVKDLELQYKSDEKPEYIRILEAHQKGAEFGYKLAHDEMDYLNKHWGNGKDKGNLTDRVRELEAQIEKMKCCGNCNKLRGRFDSKTNINILYCSDSDMKQIEVGFQMCCCKWEIKENER